MAAVYKAFENDRKTLRYLPDRGQIKREPSWVFVFTVVSTLEPAFMTRVVGAATLARKVERPLRDGLQEPKISACFREILLARPHIASKNTNLTRF